MRTGQLTRLRTAGALALVASIALTGCGRDDEAGTDDVKSDKVGAGKASGDITVWALGAEGDKLGEIAADFEADNPEAKVNITVIPFDAAHNKIATAIAGNKTPDVSLVGTTWVSEFAASGALDPTPTDLIDPAPFFEGAWGTTEVDGTSFGVPWYTETRLIYYRKDLAEKAGVTPGADWNWAEFKAFAKAMQDEGGAKWGISLQPGGQGSWQTYMPFAWQQGAELVEGEKFTFNTPPMQEALDFYASFFTEKISPTDLARGRLETGFINGEIGVVRLRSVAHGDPARPGRRGVRGQVGRGTDADRGGRDVLHRRRRPGGLQGLEEPRHRVEVRGLPDPGGSAAEAVRAGRQPAGGQEHVGDR